MTLQGLKYVIEIANCQSFSAAAKKLFVSQSTLSSAIKDMEEDLGIKIFNRTNRGAVLTYDGEDFIKYAREIVEHSQYLEQRYRSRKFIPMRFSVSSQRLPFAVRAFAKMFENLDFENYDVAIRECDTNTVIHDVVNNKSELGILIIHDSYLRSMHTLFLSYDLEFCEISTLQNFVFFRAGHPLDGNTSLKLSDLEQYPFVTYDQETESSQFSEEPVFYNMLNKNVHVSDRCTKIAMVRKTDCFSIGPDLTNSNADAFHRGMGEIRAVPLENDFGELHLGYICRKRQTLSRMAVEYLELLKEDVELISG